MRRLWLAAACGLVCLSTAGSAEKASTPRSTYRDSVYGFSLQAPSFPGAGSGRAVTPLILSGAGEHGFASSVSVNVQPLSTTRDEYRELSRDQLKKMGLRIKSEKNLQVSQRDSVLFDYEGFVQGKELRFLVLAVIDQDRVVLVTCAALAEDFPAIEPEFRACLASFSLQQDRPSP